MNILILNWRDPKHPLAGGAEQMVFEYAKYWTFRGDTITWFASSFRGAPTHETRDGIHYIRRGSHFTVFLWAFFYALSQKFNNFDFIIDCFHFFPYFSKFYPLNVPKIAIIQEVAGKLWYENLPIPLAFVGNLLEPHIIRFYKNIPFITGSNSAKNDLVKIGLKDKDITVINHGINRHKLDVVAKHKSPIIIFLGRISKDKGIEDALMTLSLLVRDFKDMKLWIVGKSESDKYEARVKKLIKQYEVTKNCQWFGYVTQKEKYELLARAWILIHPSRKEGWGLNVIEANSVGTPAVGYNVPGLTDSIIHNKTGLLVDPEVLSMADGVEKMVVEKDLYKRLCKNALEWSNNFTWENSSKKSYSLVQETVKNYNGKN